MLKLKQILALHEGAASGGHKHFSPAIKLMHTLSGDADRAAFSLALMSLTAASLLMDQFYIVDCHNSGPDGQHVNIASVDCADEPSHSKVGRIGRAPVESAHWSVEWDEELVV